MSTNKTQNYALHSWLPTDDFQLSEINQNFAALDAAARWFVGTYTGTGTKGEGKETVLGVEPWVKLVVILGSSFIGFFLRDSDQGQAFRPDGESAYEKVTWTEDSLRWYVTYHYMSSGSRYQNPEARAQFNASGTVYRYIALG